MRGHRDYPAEWPDIAQEIKEEAGWRCVRCKHPNRPGPPQGVKGLVSRRLVGRMIPCDDQCLHLRDGKKRILTLHHLDGDKGNCRWWNLPPLCQVCHLQIQAKVIMDQGYQHPHTSWFRPYVAGYYAWIHLGEDLTRQEVLDRLDELLALGQPHLNEERAYDPVSDL